MFRVWIIFKCIISRIRSYQSWNLHQFVKFLRRLRNKWWSLSNICYYARTFYCNLRLDLYGFKVIKFECSIWNLDTKFVRFETFVLQMSTNVQWMFASNRISNASICEALSAVIIFSALPTTRTSCTATAISEKTRYSSDSISLFSCLFSHTVS